MTTGSDVTLVRNAIHSPNDPRHFMQVVPSERRHRATIGDQVIADSEAAFLVKEVAYDIYEPVVYFPRADVDMAALAKIDKTTYCPLKGNTEYFDITTAGGTTSAGAWSYIEMITGDGLEGLDELKDLVAFDVSQVEVR